MTLRCCASVVTLVWVAATSQHALGTDGQYSRIGRKTQRQASTQPAVSGMHSCNDAIVEQLRSQTVRQQSKMYRLMFENNLLREQIEKMALAPKPNGSEIKYDHSLDSENKRQKEQLLCILERTHRQGMWKLIRDIKSKAESRCQPRLQRQATLQQYLVESLDWRYSAIAESFQCLRKHEIASMIIESALRQRFWRMTENGMIQILPIDV